MNDGWSEAERRAFIERETAPASAPLVPEFTLRIASELTPLWQRTETWLDEHGIPIPFWAMVWPGGQALARHVLDHPELVSGRTVADIGTGSGIVAMAAARAGARRTIAVDIDPVSRTAAELNAAANGVAVEALCENWVGRTDLAVDVLLLADVWYEREQAAAMESWAFALADVGIHVLTADPGRTYKPHGFQWVASYEVPTNQEAEGAEWKLTRVLELRPKR